MKKVVYFDDFNRRSLVIDMNTASLEWITDYQNNYTKFDIKTAQELYENKPNIFMERRPADVRIEKFDVKNNVTKRQMNDKVLLKSGAKQLGQVLFPIYSKDVEIFNKQGGLVLSSYINGSTVILFVMSFPKRYEKNIEAAKKSIVQDDDIYKETQNEISWSDNRYNELREEQRRINKDDDYIEATIKVPRELVHWNNDYNKTQELLLRNSKYLNEMHADLSSKLTYLNNLIRNSIEQQTKDEIIKKQEAYIGKLNAQIEALINDRKLLEQEKEKAELIALNNLKNRLKLSRVNLTKHDDLDESYNVGQKMNDLIVEILRKSDLSEEKQKEVIQSDEIISMILNLSNNIDSKIHSLLDIKLDFQSLNLID